jgi:Putative zinc-finger
MSPEGLRTVHQHIAVCEMCRARLSTPGQVAFAFAAFERELQQAETEDDHLPYQQLSGYVDDALREIDREIVESHLETCAECTAEVRDLRSFKSIITAKDSDVIKSPLRSERSLARLNWWARWNPIQRTAAAAGIILILTAMIFLLKSKISRQDQAQPARSPQASAEATPQTLPERPSPSAPPQMRPEGEPEKSSANNGARPSLRPEKQSTSSRGEDKQTPSSQVVVKLRDGDRLVTLSSRGHIFGVAAGAPDVQRLLASALRSQALEKPPALDRLIRGSSTQLAIVGEGSSFALQQPVGTVVQNDRPTFIWKPLKGASGYSVSIFDAQLNEVARSEALTTTMWTPPRALQRGAIYRWQVIAFEGGREVLLPSATAPEAKFKVLEQQQAEELTRARRIYAGSHLALSVLYARAGLLDEAETELKALVRDNPTSTVARKLLQSLQAWRSAPSQSSEDGKDALPPEQ